MIHDSLVEAKENNTSRFEMNSITRLLNHIKKYQKNMERINEVTKHLQMQMHSISIFQEDLELIIEDMEGKREDVDHELHGNRLGKEYISPSSSKLKNPHFESGVIKIQNNDILDMTVE